MSRVQQKKRRRTCNRCRDVRSGLEEARRKKCDVRFSFADEKKRLQKMHENWCEKIADNGFGPSESMERSSR